MHIFSIIFLGVAANLDNLGIGLSYGIRRVRIPRTANLIIAFLSGTATLITSLTGHFLAQMFSGKLCNIFGGGIVSAVGIWVIASDLVTKRKHLTGIEHDNLSANKSNKENLLDIIRNPEKADMDYSGDISIKESVLLGIALSVNCLATGLGAGMTGLSVIGITISVMVFSLTSIFLGAFWGKSCVSKLLGAKATALAGILLIILGVYEIFI